MAEQQKIEEASIAPVVQIIVCLMLLCQVIACFAGARPSLNGKVDLRAFYAAGAIIRSGHGSQLYDYDYQDQVQNKIVGPRAGALPFLYPSFAALPFVPLSLMSYRSVFFVWLGLNLGLLFVAALLLRPSLPYFCARSGWVLPGFFGCLFGVSVALMQGQISFLLLLIYCGAWILLRRDRLFLAGLVLSIGMMKFQIALPVLVLFFVWKQWRVVAGFLAGSAVLIASSVSIVGTSGAVVYWHAMAGMTKQTALHAAAAKAHYGMFPTDMPNLHGLTFGLAHEAKWGLVLNIVLCCVVLIFAARQKASLLVALPAAMLVSYHMQPHDLTLLLLPLSFLLDWMLRGARQTMRTYDVILLCSLLLLVLPLAAVVMVWGVNYVVAIAVCAVMIGAARMNGVVGTIGPAG